MIMQVNKKPVPMGDRLRRAGFDKSRYNRSEKSWTVGCSCCKPLVINGVPCHELHCTNLKKAQDGKC